MKDLKEKIASRIDAEVDTPTCHVTFVEGTFQDSIRVETSIVTPQIVRIVDEEVRKARFYEWLIAPSNGGTRLRILILEKEE